MSHPCVCTVHNTDLWNNSAQNILDYYLSTSKSGYTISACVCIGGKYVSEWAEVEKQKCFKVYTSLRMLSR